MKSVRKKFCMKFCIKSVLKNVSSLALPCNCKNRTKLNSSSSGTTFAGCIFYAKQLGTVFANCIMHATSGGTVFAIATCMPLHLAWPLQGAYSVPLHLVRLLPCNLYAILSWHDTCRVQGPCHLFWPNSCLAKSMPLHLVW